MSTWTICIVIQKSWRSSKNWLSSPLQCMSLDNLPSRKRCARMEEAILIWKGQWSWEWGHFLLRVARGTSHTSLRRLIRRGCGWLMQVVITCIRSLIAMSVCVCVCIVQRPLFARYKEVLSLMLGGVTNIYIDWQFYEKITTLLSFNYQFSRQEKILSKV